MRRDGPSNPTPAHVRCADQSVSPLKRHALETCKLTNPKCSQCRVKSSCAYFGTMLSRTRSPKADKRGFAT
jgi:hypothetical protein